MLSFLLPYIIKFVSKSYQRMTLNIKKSPIQSDYFMKIGAGNET